MADNKQWMKVGGWFGEQDMALNEMLAEKCRDGGVIVTLGVYHGRSMAHLELALRAAGRKEVRLVGVDFFERDGMETAARVLVGSKRLTLVRSDVVEAAGMFADGSVDAVFLDAGRDKRTVAACIKAWQPKLVADGVMCGHDYTCTDSWPEVKKAVDSAYRSVENVGRCWIGKEPK